MTSSYEVVVVGGGPAGAAAALALAEAAVLADAYGSVQGSPDNTARETVAFAERAVELARRAGDPVAAAQLDRAEALLDGEPARVRATAAAFDAAGCSYQSARSHLLAGGGGAGSGAGTAGPPGLSGR